MTSSRRKLLRELFTNIEQQQQLQQVGNDMSENVNIRFFSTDPNLCVDNLQLS